MREMSDGILIVGYALVHFVWQGALLSLALAGALRLFRGHSANVRYVLACVALAAMLAAPVTTLAALAGWGPTVAPAPDPAPSVAASGTVSSTADDGRAPGAHPWWWADQPAVERALPSVVLAWVVGVTLLLGRMGGGLLRVHRLHAAALAATASGWQATAERLASRLGLRVRVRVVETARVAVPAVVGWVRPVILLPVATLTNLTPSQLEAILVHELAHIRRHDYVMNLLQTVAETLLFYHPGVWWVSRRIRLERESCCDDVAVEVCGDAVEYAAALTELEAGRTGGAVLSPAATGGPLLVRVRRLLNAPEGRAPRPSSALAVGGITVALVLGLGLGHALPLLDPSPASAGLRVEDPIASPETFDWHVRPTEHFEIHSYPALEDDLPLIEVAAEQAYRRVSSELGQELPFKVPLVLFKTRGEFMQQGIAPEASMEWVRSFSEPVRNRIVLLVEGGEDAYPLITHELTHIFMFGIVPRGNAETRVPIWIDEGLAEYVTGAWATEDLVDLAGIVEAGRVPDMSTLEVAGQPPPADGTSPIRGAVLLGHAAFDFVEARLAEEAISQFPFALRGHVVDGADLYQTAFGMTAAEFDVSFRQYLEERFASVK